jgi:DNA-binding XRE family transcriptional regulator
MLKNSVKTMRMSERQTKAGLARAIGVCASYITRLENNDIQPSGDVMFRFAEHFKCKIEDLFWRVPDAGKR